MNKKFYIVLIVLGLIGLSLSLYLAWEYYQPNEIGCPLGDAEHTVINCEAVKESEYSVFLGVKLPIWGTLYFLFVLAVLGYGYFEDRFKDLRSKFDFFKYYDKIAFGILLWGALFESYMTYIAVAKIEAVCTWCLGVELVTFLMFVVYLIGYMIGFKKERKLVEEEAIRHKP